MWSVDVSGLPRCGHDHGPCHFPLSCGSRFVGLGRSRVLNNYRFDGGKDEVREGLLGTEHYHETQSIGYPSYPIIERKWLVRLG